MTNKQIAAAYMAGLLGEVARQVDTKPGFADACCGLAEMPRLSADNVQRVAACVKDECARLRSKYVERLNRAGYDTV